MSSLYDPQFFHLCLESYPVSYRIPIYERNLFFCLLSLLLYLMFLLRLPSGPPQHSKYCSVFLFPLGATLLFFASWSSMSSVCSSTHYCLSSAPVTPQELLLLRSTLSCSSICLAFLTPLPPISSPALPQVSVWAPHPSPSPYLKDFPRVLCSDLFSLYTPCFGDLSFHVTVAICTGLNSFATKFVPSWNLRVWPYLEVRLLLL